MIFHLCELEDWKNQKNSKEFVAKSLFNEGFIHFSTYGQILEIADHLYSKAQHPILLAIENNQVSDQDLKWEGIDGLEFPHLYRPIQFDEVKAILELPQVNNKFQSTPDLDHISQSIKIETDRLVLREIKLSDFEAIHEYAQDEELLKYMIWGPNSKTQTREFLSRVFRWQTENPRSEFHFAVTLKENKKLIGACNISIESFNHQTASIGYILSPEYHHFGFASETSKALLDFGFRQLHLNRIEATCDSRNTSSFQLMKRIGMKHEGCLRQNLVLKGHRRDTLVYAILKEEYLK